MHRRVPDVFGVRRARMGSVRKKSVPEMARNESEALDAAHKEKAA